MKMKVIIQKNTIPTEIPETPFVINYSGCTSHYIISKQFQGEKYVLMNLDDGTTYDQDYTYAYVLSKIIDGSWIIRESEIKIK